MWIKLTIVNVFETSLLTVALWRDNKTETITDINMPNLASFSCVQGMTPFRANWGL